MAAWEEISSTYAEAATRALPLHRFLIFATGFLVSLGVQQQTHLSILETLSVLKLSSLTSFDKGFFEEATVASVMWAIVATALSVIVSKGMARLAYRVVDHATGASTKAQNLDRSWLGALSVEEKKAAVELLDSGLNETRSRIRMLTGLNELLIGLFITFASALHWGNLLDGSVAAVAIIGAVISHMAAISTFLSEYYGPALIRAQLQGKAAPRVGKVTGS